MKSALRLLLLLPFQLFSQTDDSWKLYDDSHVARVDITVDPATLAWVFANVQSDSEHAAFVRFRNNWIDETVDSVGFRLRGNTSRGSAKKSFKISFNTFFKGKEFHGVEKLNLNGEHNDPSITRSKLSFDLFRDIGMVAPRANHAEVYINGAYYGLYVSVEHVNDAFLAKRFRDDSGNLWKCLYPADLAYLGEDPQAYRDIGEGSRPAYELKTNEEVADFSKLIRLIRHLHDIPGTALPDSLEPTFDVPAFLKYMAMNVLLGSWDDYRSLMNNYYLYHDPSRDRIVLIPYDYDNTFGIDWFNVDWSATNPYDVPEVVAGPRPLVDRLLANNQYRNLYTHALQFYNENVFRLTHWEHRIDSIKARIAPYALADTFRSKDYGFTEEDFHDSYSGPYINQHVKRGLKEYVNRRSDRLHSLSMVSMPPMVYDFSVSPRYPKAGDSIVVTMACFGSDGVAEVRVEGVAAFIEETYAERRPVPGTKRLEEADRWVAVLPPLNAGEKRTFRVAIKDSLGRSVTYPRGEFVTIQAAGDAATDLVLNEFMADNDNTFADPAGDYDDWLEIYNRGTAPILLTGLYLTDNPANLAKWETTQPDLVIQPGEFVVIWCDEEALETGLHSNFKLGAGGEFLAITAADGVTVLDSLSFGPQQLDVSFGRLPSGTGLWQVVAATPGASNVAATSVGETLEPRSFAISAFPNPFNPEVQFTFRISDPGFVVLRAFDMIGREVRVLITEEKPAGKHTFVWNAAGLPSGVYLCRLEVRGQGARGSTQSRTVRVVLAR